MPDHDLIARGRHAAQHLITLLPLVRGDHKQQNASLFANVLAEAPALENRSWGELAFIVRIYAGFIGKQSSSDQRLAFWSAGTWALSYESRMRPKMLNRLARALVGFAKDGAGDRLFVDAVSPTLPEFLSLLDRQSLTLARTELRSLRLDNLDALIDSAAEQLPAESMEKRESDNGPAGTLSRLWHYLDRKREVQNQKELDQVRTEGDSAAGHSALAKLGGAVLRSIVQRYRREVALPDSDIDLALGLAPEIIRHSPSEFKAKAATNAAVLRAIRDTTRGSFDKTAFITAMPTPLKDGDRDSWNTLAACITTTLSKMPAGDQAKDSASEWAKTFDEFLKHLDDGRTSDFYLEGKKHAPDSLLLDKFKPREGEKDKSNDWVSALLDAYRQMDLKATARILKDSRAYIISDLCGKLASTAPGFDAILPPRRAIRMLGPKRQDGRPSDAFQEAKRLVESQREDDRRRGYELFEQYADKKIHPDYKALTREWMLYARVRLRGLPAVFTDWQKDLKAKAASPEEVWNLAVFNVKLEDFAAALDALRPGIESLRAPYAHLRFAIYCALQLVELSELKPDSLAAAQRFLVDTIRLHPLPESYLVWLLIVEEMGIGTTPQEKLAVLGTFQQLQSSPLPNLDPEAENSDSDIEAYRKQLNELKLDRTWLLWINDYSERNVWRTTGFLKLAEALEEAKKELEGALDRAEEAYQRLVDLQRRQYEQRQEKSGNADARFLRNSLISLFNFYKRNVGLESQRLNAYKRYSRDASCKLCFDPRDPSSGGLVSLTRDLIEASNTVGTGTGPAGSARPMESGGQGGGGSNDDVYIADALKRVSSANDLKAIQDRVVTWIDRRIRGGSIVQQRANLIKELVLDVARVESEKRTQVALNQQTRQLNNQIATAKSHLSSTKELRPLQPVLDAVQLAYENFVKATSLQPKIDVSVLPPGIPIDAPETSIVLDCENHGPGDISNVRIACNDHGNLTSREQVRISSIKEGDQVTVAVPVRVSRTGEPGVPLDFEVRVTHDSGVLRDLSANSRAQTQFFDFLSHLNRTSPGAYEIPIPYTEDPIDFSRNDVRLFQGRDGELDQVRAILSGQLKTDPIYYHGVRKVGKSSLLGRIRLELANADVLPLMIRLEGIRAGQQPLPLIINTFTSKIVEAARTAGAVRSNLEAVSVHDPNPIMATFGLLHSLSDNLDGRRIALLVDEFQNLAAPVAIPLLDILRQLFQERRLLLFFSGYYRPKRLENETRERETGETTQLFPLLYRGIDFLSRDAVARVLREPLQDVEIAVPESAVDTAYSLTAGNPHHVAALAIRALNRLNAERRLCITGQDFDAAAEGIVIDDRYFRSTIFSQTILTPEERDGAIRFSQAQGGKKTLPVSEATGVLSAELLDDLREKGILQRYSEGEIGVRGGLLAKYLESRIIESAPAKPQGTDVRKVGLFVDLENVRPHVPAGAQWTDIGKALIRYAEQFGSVEAKWAGLDPANFTNSASVRLALEKDPVYFLRVAYPSTPRTRDNRQDRADAVLVRVIYDELSHTMPDVFVIVSGDHKYSETVSALLEKGYEVHVLGAAESLSHDYRFLEKEDAERRLLRGLDGQKMFVDDDLPKAIQGKADTASAE